MSMYNLTKIQTVNRVLNKNQFKRSFATKVETKPTNYAPPYVVNKRNTPLAPKTQWNKYLQQLALESNQYTKLLQKEYQIYTTEFDKSVVKYREDRAAYLAHKQDLLRVEQTRRRSIFKKIDAVLVDQKERLKLARERERAQYKKDTAAARQEFLAALQEESGHIKNSVLDLHFKPYDFLGWSPSQKLARWMRNGVNPVLNLKFKYNK